MMADDPYVRYRQSDLRGRTIDTLIGISKGIIADGKVNQLEAEALLGFLVESDESKLSHPVMDGLLDRMGDMLQDGVLDDEEALELHELLTSISGGISTWGELSKPATLPINDPAPTVIFEDRRFLFSGNFMFGTKADCKRAVRDRGGDVVTYVTRSLDYLVIGTYAAAAWKHHSFGTKIEKAMEYRASGKSSLAIIAEEHWRASL